MVSRLQILMFRGCSSIDEHKTSWHKGIRIRIDNGEFDDVLGRAAELCVPRNPPSALIFSFYFSFFLLSTLVCGVIDETDIFDNIASFGD